MFRVETVALALGLALELVRESRRVELVGRARVLHGHDGVVVAGEVELAPRDVDVTVARIDRHGGALVGALRGAVQAEWCSPAVAAIDRSREVHVVARALAVGGAQRIGDIDRASREILGNRALLARRRDHAARRVARNIHGHPWLVEEVASRAARIGDERARTEIREGIPGFLVVVVNEARDEDGALAGVGGAGGRSIEDQTGVVNQAIGARAHDRIGTGTVAADRRGQSERRGVLRVSGQERADPALPAVE